MLGRNLIECLPNAAASEELESSPLIKLFFPKYLLVPGSKPGENYLTVLKNVLVTWATKLMART